MAWYCHGRCWSGRRGRLRSPVFQGTRRKSYEPAEDFRHRSDTSRHDLHQFSSTFERPATVPLIACHLQVVYEERFIGKYNIPALQAVGWEGLFGFMTLGLLLIPVKAMQVNSIRHSLLGLVPLHSHVWIGHRSR